MSNKHPTPLPAEVYTTEASQSAERSKQEKGKPDKPEDFKKLIAHAHAEGTKNENAK
jgi:hypothetical protein